MVCILSNNNNNNIHAPYKFQRVTFEPERHSRGPFYHVSDVQGGENALTVNGTYFAQPKA